MAAIFWDSKCAKVHSHDTHSLKKIQTGLIICSEQKMRNCQEGEGCALAPVEAGSLFYIRGGCTMGRVHNEKKMSI